MISTPRMIAEFMAQFDTSFTVDEVAVDHVVGLDTWYKLTSCKPSYGYVNAVVNGTMTVTERGENYLVVKSATVLTPGVYTLNLPSFIHGTQKAVKNEMDIKKSILVYPLVYLQEVVSDRIVAEKRAMIGRYSQCRIWFLLANKQNNEVTIDHYQKYIDAMTILAERFIDQIWKYKYFAKIEDDFSMFYHANIGSNSDLGYLKDYFTQSMSGVELRAFSLPVTREYCNC